MKQVTAFVGLVVFMLIFSSSAFASSTVAGWTTRVSVTSTGIEGNGYSDAPSISADGRFVAFESLASNLVPGDSNNNYDIFVYDRQKNTIELISVSLAGTPGNAESTVPIISANGRYVVFQSGASDLVANDTNHFF